MTTTTKIWRSSISGFEEIQRQLDQMSVAAQGKALRSAVFKASLPVLKRAKAAVPVGAPPYESIGGHDPYPVRSYKGNLYTPGHAQRNIARKTIVSEDKTFVRVMIGVRPEAWYAVQFYEIGSQRKPWLQPALRDSIGEIDLRMSAFFKAAINAAAKSKR